MEPNTMTLVSEAEYILANESDEELLIYLDNEDAMASDCLSYEEYEAEMSRDGAWNDYEGQYDD